DIEFCRLTSADVVRHELVGAIIDAYQRYDDRNAARRARTRSHNTARREYTS
ncbi:MAG: PhoH family protein, partial [Pauljensenia sp.]